MPLLCSLFKYHSLKITAKRFFNLIFKAFLISKRDVSAFYYFYNFLINKNGHCLCPTDLDSSGHAAGQGASELLSQARGRYDGRTIASRQWYRWLLRCQTTGDMGTAQRSS